MYLVTQGRGRVNQLGYLARTHEYVYIHKGKEIWREVGDSSLFDYFNEVRGGRLFEDKEVKDNPIYQRYSNDCFQFEKQEHPEIYGYRG